MYLIPHPGLCCGVSSIHGFQYPPEAKAGALTAQTLPSYRQAYPTFTWPGVAWPEETNLRRFKRFIQYAENRPSGIIEIVLKTSQLPPWKEALKELSFKESCRNVNSNSGNVIVMFHRLSGAEGVAKIIKI